MSDEIFDVIVIGGGHAGTEAAAVCARMGAKALLLTQDVTRIGALSCNPSIGGIGKSHLVREVDALDGLMARAADQACIHNKTLNRSKGPAVRGVRVQADRALYAAAIQAALRATPGLTIREGEASAMRLSDNGAISGVDVGDQLVKCRALVIATGTFLRGVTHIGQQRQQAGRRGDAASISLAECLDRLGLPLGRLKTGTPPRLARDTIAWGQLPADRGDDDPSFLSFDTDALSQRQVECRVTHTTPVTHDVIRRNLGRSAMYGGGITSVGPRYCPSIEDKIVRFADRERHQVFLEPEGLPDTPHGRTVYPNGISTSLPSDVQLDLVRSMPGLERAEITEFGYAVEYDFVQPTALDHTLHLRRIPGLFLAGQINGTTGYEEAAAQGIYAGINAVRWLRSQPAFILDRASSYIGVLVDDLVSRTLTEPYRMFTSRAEFRLSLRCDNADLRLSPLGVEIGCVSSGREAAFRQYEDATRAAIARACRDTRSPKELSAAGIPVKQDGVLRSLLDVVTSDTLDGPVIEAFPWCAALPRAVQVHLAITGLYHGYLHQQRGDMAYMRGRSTASGLVRTFEPAATHVETIC